VKKLLTCLALTFLCSIAAAQEDNQPFLELAKGNTWKYDVAEREEKSSGQLTIEEIGSNGRLKVKAENLGAGFPEEMTWEISGGFLVWRIGPEFEWKVLKLDASKDDTWEGKPNKSSKLTLKSKVMAREKVTVPAGSFNSLKIETTTEGGENPPVIYMWWARKVGLVKVETVEFGKKHTSWTLTKFTAGYSLSNETLKELLEKADVVAQVSIPKKGAGAKEVNAKLACSFKGEPKAENGCITLALPEPKGNFKPFETGEFVVFLKKAGSSFVLLHDTLPANSILLDRLTKFVTPPGETLEKLKALCDKSEIVAGIEIVKLEDRVDFKYYVAKILGAAKGAEGRKHVDVRSVPGLKLEKGKKYLVFLSRTKVQGRTMLSPTGANEGVLDYDEGFLGKLKEICKEAGR
jgi:hypothetical protein